MRWHFHFTPPAEGAWNMARDEALMRRASRTGDAVFRVYGWATPTLSLGRNQRARGCYDATRGREMGVTFVRRPTGGRALLHHREVTYSATLPVSDAHGARLAYEFINDVLLDGLRRLGVEAERAVGAPSIPPGPRPCFDRPAEREIALDGRKLVGSAQWHREGALLQHGSILVRDDQGMIAHLMNASANELPPAATLSGALGFDPSLEQVAEPMRASLRCATGADVAELAAEASLDADTVELCSTYEDDAWTWRR